MKSLFVLLCVALCGRAAAIETLEAAEGNIQPYVSVEAENEQKLVLPEEDEIAVIEDQQETGSQGLRRFCGGDWTEFDGSCYYLIKTSQTWPTAEAECISQGATLVILDTKREMQYLHTRFLGFANGQKMWTGGYYFQTRWGRVDGKKFDYEGGKGPEGNPETHSCIILDSQSTTGINGGECIVSSFPAICEMSSTQC